jgi:uncharacterized membrane protein YfcA
MPGFETLTPPLIAWIVAVVILSGFVQGALGLGFPTLATPLIAVVTDIRTAVIIVLLPCLGAIAMGLARSGHLRETLAQFWMMPIYMLIGAAIGTRIFIAYPEFPYALLLAALIVVYLNLERIGRGESRYMRERRNLFGCVFGVTAGVTEGTANVAAPALVVYYLAIAVQPTLLAQALNICFFTGKSTQFVTLASAGGVTATQWAMTLPLAVVAAAGTVYGIAIRNRIDAATYKRWLRGALWAIAFILVAQVLYEALK